MHFYDGYHFWGMHALWWIFWIALVVIALLTFRGRPTRMPGNETPLERLQNKYVNGEITKEEYQERKAVLEADREEREKKNI